MTLPVKCLVFRSLSLTVIYLAITAQSLSGSDFTPRGIDTTSKMNTGGDSEKNTGLAPDQRGAYPIDDRGIGPYPYYSYPYSRDRSTAYPLSGFSLSREGEDTTDRMNTGGDTEKDTGLAPDQRGAYPIDDESSSIYDYYSTNGWRTRDNRYGWQSRDPRFRPAYYGPYGIGYSAPRNPGLAPSQRRSYPINNRSGTTLYYDANNGRLNEESPYGWNYITPQNRRYENRRLEYDSFYDRNYPTYDESYSPSIYGSYRDGRNDDYYYPSYKQQRDARYFYNR